MFRRKVGRKAGYWSKFFLQFTGVEFYVTLPEDFSGENPPVLTAECEMVWDTNLAKEIRQNSVCWSGNGKFFKVSYIFGGIIAISDEQFPIEQYAELEQETLQEDYQDLFTPSVTETTQESKTEKWYNSGVLHRECDLPAVIVTTDDCVKMQWYVYGIRTRVLENDPTEIIEYTNGEKVDRFHSRQGLLDSTENPAEIYYDSSGEITHKIWYQTGRIHRHESYPSIEYTNGDWVFWRDSWFASSQRKSLPVAKLTNSAGKVCWIYMVNSATKFYVIDSGSVSETVVNLNWDAARNPTRASARLNDQLELLGFSRFSFIPSDTPYYPTFLGDKLKAVLAADSV